MKKLLIVLFAVCVVCSLAFGQWTDRGEWPDTTTYGHYRTGGHGMATGGDGTIWYMSYWVADSVWVPEHHDTTATGADTTILAQYNNCRACYVFDPTDGSQKSFSPIKIITYPDEHSDTLWNSGRGMRQNPDGNVAICNWQSVRLVDYTDGSGIQSVVPFPGNSIVSPGFDDEGNMFIAMVVQGGNPVKAFDDVFDYIDDVISGDVVTGYARTMEVSGDGKDIYVCTFTDHVVRWHSDAGLDGTYEVADTVTNMSVEACGWQPVTGYLWMGESATAFTKGNYYAYDPATDAFVDSIVAPLESKPRGITFSLDGQTAYITYYDPGTAIFMYEKASGVWEHTNTMAVGYELKQNYPNPFNAATVIPFRIDKAADVKLTVYDMVGNEVRTLVDEKMDKGSYNIDFDATGLATGMYVYRLETNGLMFSKKMMFVK